MSTTTIGNNRPDMALLPDAARWFAPLGATRAVALVLHGLNMRPAKMDRLAQWLAERDVAAYRASLIGHEGDLAAFKRARRADFLASTAEAYQVAADRAHAQACPLWLVGFSYGALLAYDLIAHRDQAGFARAVLFAPAIAPRRSARVALALRFLGETVIPSLSRRDFRAHVGSPVSAFVSLFDSVEATAAAGYRGANVPTLVFVDPKDSLVSLRGIEQLKSHHHLDAWRIVPVTTVGGSLNKTYHHLITQPECVSPTQWQAIEMTIASHLGLPPHPPAPTSKG